MSKERGIYCIETAHWTAGGGSQPSVEPLLRLIQSTQGTPYIHRPFSTWEELHGLLGEAMHGRYRRYPILYVACHGETCRLALRRKRSNGHRNGAINFEELAIPLRQRGGGKLILFSACSLMKASEATLRRLWHIPASARSWATSATSDGSNRHSWNSGCWPGRPAG
jgi:hypothetical protein